MTKQQDNGEEQAPEEKPEKKGQSFGTWLRQQRVVREIELREIAETSKISMRYLRALEDDRFDILPASVFAKGFLRQYAKYVGLDPEEVVNFFISARQETEEDEEPVVTRRKDSTSPWTYLGIFFLVAALLLGVVWFAARMGDANQDERAGTEATDAPVSSSVTSSTSQGVGQNEVADPRTGFGAAGVDAEQQADPEVVAEDSSPDIDATEVASEDSPGSPQVSTAESGTAIPPAASQSPSLDAPLVVTLDFSGECWVEVTADGAPRVGEMRVQGESLSASAEREIVLKLGDISVVEIEVNGLPYRVEPVAGSAVRTVRIDLETARALAGETAAP